VYRRIEGECLLGNYLLGRLSGMWRTAARWGCWLSSPTAPSTATSSGPSLAPVDGS